MRLIFKAAAVHTGAWLAATAKHGVGSVRLDPGYWEKVEEVEREFDEPRFKDKDGKPLKVKAKVKEVTFGRSPFLSFDFYGPDGNADAVLALAQAAGLELVEKRDEVLPRKTETRIMPKLGPEELALLGGAP